MGVTSNYDRRKLTQINSTGIDIVAKAAEEPAAPADLAQSTGIVNIEFEGDADDSGGVALVNLFRVEDLQVAIDSLGVMTLTGSITPVGGDGLDLPTTAISTVHPENCDAWQAAAGRARQV